MPPFLLSGGRLNAALFTFWPGGLVPPFLRLNASPMPSDPTDPARAVAPALSPIAVGLLGRCPRCGKGSMFKDLLALADRCPACGLDLTFADTGDGPAFFASFIGGFIVLGVGVWLQIAYEPALWVYPIVFIPLGLVVCVALLRLVKGVLVSLQYAHKAGQGRLEP
jgi:uncharacterized protein (DUF983 family)